MRTYLYKNLRYHHNGFCWVVYYLHNGGAEKLGLQMTKRDAEILGRQQVDYMNKKEA